MLHPFVNTAVRCARRAGTIILRNLDKLDRLTVEAKGRADWVSEVDRLCEQEIIDGLSHAYPEHAFMGEEGGMQAPKRPHGDGALNKPANRKPAGRRKPIDDGYCWVIDPLDGTTNFLHGLPHFAVSIACCRGDKVEHGVVFNPMLNELFVASRGQGAQLNDRRLRVSHNNRMENALIATGFNFKDASRLQPWLVSYGMVTARSGGVRRCGAAALDLAYVAAGRLDAFYEMNLSLWDYAAASLLVEEAGGLISDFGGTADWYANGHIVASNNTLHQELLPLLSACRQATAG